MSDLTALAVALPLLMAAVLMGARPLLSRRAIDALGLLTSAAVLALCVALVVHSSAGARVSWMGGWAPRDGMAIGVALVVEPFGAGLSALAAALMSASLAFSWRYFKAVGALYHALMLAFLGGTVGFCLSGDLFTRFVMFELSSVAAYALAAYKIEDEKSLEGALNFAVVNSLGALLVLIGIALVYGRTGALNLAEIGRALAEKPADGLVLSAFLLIVSGFCVKAAIVPFHFWVADAHAVAPTPVCALFSGVMVELGIYDLAHTYATAFSGAVGPHAGAWGGLLIGAGAISSIVGALMCLLQRNLKRMLAFSTISQGGILLMAVGLLDAEALAGGAYLLVGHGLVKGALFLLAGILLHRGSSVDEFELRGFGRGMPATGTCFALSVLGLIGLPPFGTATGHALLASAARGAGVGWVAPVGALAAALAGGALLRARGGSSWAGGRRAMGTPGPPRAPRPRRPWGGRSSPPGTCSRRASPCSRPRWRWACCGASPVTSRATPASSSTGNRTPRWSSTAAPPPRPSRSSAVRPTPGGRAWPRPPSPSRWPPPPCSAIGSRNPRATAAVGSPGRPSMPSAPSTAGCSAITSRGSSSASPSSASPCSLAWA